MSRFDVWLRVLTVRLTGLGPNATFSGSLLVKVSTHRCPVADKDVVRKKWYVLGRQYTVCIIDEVIYNHAGILTCGTHTRALRKGMGYTLAIHYS